MKHYKSAKEEILSVCSRDMFKCAYVTYTKNIPHKVFVLKENHTEADLNDFLEDLDFEYDNGYGEQYLFGNVWLKDGSWLDRGEYDGCEWWAVRSTPKIPHKCLEVDIKEENKILRQVICDILTKLGNGAGMLPDVSLDFIKQIPKEVEAEINRLKAHK
jgi:hypothetical protein